MNETLNRQLDALNCQYKFFDMIYHKLAIKFSISDSELIILYEIYTSNKPLSQKDLCTLYCISKQTINSSIKKLQNSGYIILKNLPNSKHKIIILTDTGKIFCDNTISKVIEIEKKSLECLSDTQREALITVTDLYLKNLNINADNFIKEDLI